MAENDPSYKALRIELSQLADRLAPHHFKVLSKGLALWDRELSPSSWHRSPVAVPEEKILPHQEKKEAPPAQSSFLDAVHTEALVGVEALESTSDFDPFDAKFEAKFEERELHADHAFVVKDSRSFFAKGFWFVTAHIFDMAMITVCALMTLLSFKVALLGYEETLRDGLSPLIDYWFKTFTWQEILMGLYAIFLFYAVLFYLIVGATIGGLVSRPRAKS